MFELILGDLCCLCCPLFGVIVVLIFSKGFLCEWEFTYYGAYIKYVYWKLSFSTETASPGKPSNVRTRTGTDTIMLMWQRPKDEILVRGYMVGYGEGVPDVNWQYVDANTNSFTIKNLSE